MAVTSDAWLGHLDKRLAEQLRFLIEIDRLKLIVRASRIADGSRHENSAEHSWHIALCADVLAEWAIGEVSVERVIRMLLLHDVVEIDAGDVPLFAPGPSADQQAAEAAAATRLFGLLPAHQASVYRALWDEFESAETADARFARAIDRLQPILLNHINGGGTWTDYDVDADQVKARTGHIADGSSTLWQVAQAAFDDAVANGWLKPSAATLPATPDPAR